MADHTDAREALLSFLDDRVFLPALSADPDSYAEEQRKMLSRVQNSVRGTRLKYHEEYTTAARIKTNFRSDLGSTFGQNLAADMFFLRLTRFEDVKDEFVDLCREYGV